MSMAPPDGTITIRDTDIQGATNVANDAHPSQFRLDERLKDPDAAALVNYLNGTDLKFLKDNITQGDRLLSVISDPTSWPVAVMGGESHHY